MGGDDLLPPPYEVDASSASTQVAVSLSFSFARNHTRPSFSVVASACSQAEQFRFAGTGRSCLAESVQQAQSGSTRVRGQNGDYGISAGASSADSSEGRNRGKRREGSLRYWEKALLTAPPFCLGIRCLALDRQD